VRTAAASMAAATALVGTSVVVVSCCEAERGQQPVREGGPGAGSGDTWSVARCLLRVCHIFLHVSLRDVRVVEKFNRHACSLQ
jgi:hypothetical protein